MNKGFTLIELVVVTAIIVLLTGLALPNYRAGSQQLALQRSAHKLAQDLRRAGELALSSQEFAGQTPSGYGIYFNTNQPNQYILFADLNGNRQYNGLSEKMEIIILEATVSIRVLAPDPYFLTIVFVPPDPSVYFSPLDASTASITLFNEEAMTVQVNKVGLIYVK